MLRCLRHTGGSISILVFFLWFFPHQFTSVVLIFFRNEIIYLNFFTHQPFVRYNQFQTKLLTDLGETVAQEVSLAEPEVWAVPWPDACRSDGTVCGSASLLHCHLHCPCREDCVLHRSHCIINNNNEAKSWRSDLKPG